MSDNVSTAGRTADATGAEPAAGTEPEATSTPVVRWQDWLNPATIRGAILVAVGVFILSTPNASAELLRFVVGAAMMINGAVTLWHHVRGRESTRSYFIGAAEAGLLLALGFFLLVYPVATLDVLALVIGILLAARGALAILAGFRRVHQRRVVDFVRGAAMLALSVFAIATPSSLVSSLVLLSGAAAIAFGGLLIASGARAASHGLAGDVDAASLTRVIAEWVDTWDIGRERREEIGDGLYFEDPDRASKLIAWWVMLLLSVVIATFAVLQDSTAVVIGAMLVAPLMVPILGASAAIVNGEQHRVGADMLLVLLGVAASIGLAFIVAKWAPALVPLDANSQVTSRVNPNVIDMGIALAAGAAGAFATVNKRVASSIAGVAIAVALVPPLAVVGVTLEAGEYDDAFGAFLLFSTNLVAILLAAVVVFILSGYTSAVRIQENRQQMISTLTVVGGIAIIILLPLVFTAEQIITDQIRQSQAQEVAADWLADSEGLSLESVVVTEDEVVVEVSGSDRLPSVEELGVAMQDELGATTTTTVEFTPATVTTYTPDGSVTSVDSQRLTPAGD